MENVIQFKVLLLNGNILLMRTTKGLSFKVKPQIPRGFYIKYRQLILSPTITVNRNKREISMCLLFK